MTDESNFGAFLKFEIEVFEQICVSGCVLERHVFELYIALDA